MSWFTYKWPPTYKSLSKVPTPTKVDSPDTLKDVTDAIPPITLVDIPDFIEKSELDAGVPEMEETTLIAFPCPTLTLVKLFWFKSYCI